MSGAGSRPLLFVAILLIAITAGLAWWISAPDTLPPATTAPEPVATPASPPAAALEAPDGTASRAENPAPATTERPDSKPASPEPAVPGRPGRIEGHVLRRDGSPAPKGTLVFAREAASPPDDADIVGRIQRRDPTVPTATSDADGRFVLENLPRGASFSLSAAGRGYLSTGLVAVPEGTTDARIEVALLYGIAVEIHETGGKPLRTAVAQGDPLHPDATHRLAVPDGPLLELVGADLWPYRDGPARRLFLFTFPRTPEPPSLEHVPLTFRFSGYEPAAREFEALPILPAIPAHTVELRPVAGDFGEIVVRFDGGRDPTMDQPRVRPVRLQIRSSNAYSADIDVPRTPGEKRLEGIPFARYRVSILNSLDQQIYPRPGPPARPFVEVGPGPARLDISLSGTSELAIEIRREQGKAYEGPGVFGIGFGRPTPDGKSLVGPTVTVNFDRGPYVLRGLLPGHYILFVKEPAGAVVEATSPNGLFDLAPDGVKTIWLELP